MRRKSAIGLVLLGGGLVLVAAAFFGVGFWLSPQSDLEKSDAIVAISGGETTLRAAEAIRLQRDGWAPKIIFSGAALDPDSPSNARAMERQALAAGVSASDIILDESSTNTIENANGVGEIVKAAGMKRIILVTSPYHQRRASLTFRHKLPPEVKIINHSTTDHNWRRSHWWATPYSRDLTWSELGKTLYELFNGRE